MRAGLRGGSESAFLRANRGQQRWWSRATVSEARQGRGRKEERKEGGAEEKEKEEGHAFISFMQRGIDTNTPPAVLLHYCCLRLNVH
eukprot:COSAG06_NODE_4966_length_3824_cov_13.185772_2_plen_87_part_00